MIEIVISFFLITGSLFCLIASLGILRFPDIYMRMHAVTKAGTVGVGFVLVAVAISLNDITVTSRVFLTILFLLLTAPAGSHLLGKGALKSKYEFWRNKKQ